MRADQLITLAEHRLQINIDRLSALDTRAGVFLGVILSLGTAIVTLVKHPHSTATHRIPVWFHIPRHDAWGMIGFVIATLCAIASLSLRSQWDIPKIEEFPDLLGNEGLSYYLGSIEESIKGNNEDATLKTQWLEVSLLVLFCSLVCIIVI